MKTPLEKELTALLNQHSRENESNTPDFLLADYLMRCLQTWEAVTRRRDEWYGDRKWPNIVWPTTRKEPQHENEG